MNLISILRHSIKSSLSKQYLLFILPITFVMIGLGAWILHMVVMDHVDSARESNLVNMADTIEDVLQYAFMVNDTELLQQIIFDIGLQENAYSVRLLSRESNILASSIPDEVGIRLNRFESPCRLCHTAGEGQHAELHVNSFKTDNSNVVFVANQVENQIACQGCHSDAGPYLGLLLVELPTEQIDSWRTLFTSGLIVGVLLFGILISGISYSAFSIKVLQPLQDLTRRLDLKRASFGENEIGRLLRHFGEMDEKLAIKEIVLAEEHKKIDTIISLQYDTDHPPSTEKFYRQALGLVQEVTGYSTITLREYEPRTQSYRLMAQSGMSSKMIKDLETIPMNVGFHAEVAKTHWPVFTSDMPSDNRLSSAAPVKEGYQSLVCIPLLAANFMVGTMQIALKYEHAWSESELRWLALIGRRIGLLVHHIQLTQRLRDMAVIEERARISQEIHDGLAQLIGSLRLWSEQALISLDANNSTAVRETVQRIETAASDAYESLRDEMLGLRENIFSAKNLSAIITEYLNRFHRQWGIRTQLRVESKAQNLQPWPISPASEIQLLRIIQESLTNIRRHANASSINLVVSIVDGYLTFLIQDDGIGFDMDKIPEDRLGLQIMRERVASIGGAIRVSSQVGLGTTLEIHIPIEVAPKIQAGQE